MSEANLDAKYIQMTQTPVESLICRLAVPTIISNLITTFYNMADTFLTAKSAPVHPVRWELHLP